jgi:3-hydroxyisobutyrate dehydrogenase-like beta-hydroxyacid dehydrogenase
MSDTPMIGVAGCGAMGLPMAENLRHAGFNVCGYDVRPISEFGAFHDRMIEDPAAFTSQTDILVSVVRDIKQTDDLLFDDQAIMARDDHPKLIVLSSTLSPRYVVEVEKRLSDIATVVDAPMSGAPYRAREGTLTFMVGGDAESVASLRLAFQAMGDEVHHMGPTGAGAATKVSNNLCAAAGVVAVRRALAASKAYGIASEDMLAVMRSSSGSTWYGDNLDKIDWADEGYDPANTMGILEKDVSSFVDALGGTDTMTWGPFEEAILDEIRRMEPLQK